jgi:hypothetical protein
VLRAIAVALGGLPADRDDLTVGGPETTAIDVVLAPLRSPNAGWARRAGAKRRWPRFRTLKDSCGPSLARTPPRLGGSGAVAHLAVTILIDLDP